jgi:hypothetical protein
MGKISTKQATRGQFFTTNEELLDIQLPFTKKDTVIEPFAGDRFLSTFLKNKCKSVIDYDKFPTSKDITKRDTLLNPPDYRGKFVMTNPPFSPRNRQQNTENMKIYKKYDTDDLYKAFLKSVLPTVSGGVVIIPMNFLTGIRTKDVELRNEMFSNFKILEMKIFEQKMFDDAAIAVVVISFKRYIPMTSQTIPVSINGIKKNLTLRQENDWLHGGEIYTLNNGKNIVVRRVHTPIKNSLIIQNIDLPSSKPIHLRLRKNETHFGNNQRAYATMVVSNVPAHKLPLLCERFNTLLNAYRKKYDSLFLSSFYENKRKYIPLTLVYVLIAHVASKL